ncbi:MAG: signal peptidase II [Eubacteriales bacterium]
MNLMKNKKILLIVDIVLLILLVALDQITKSIAVVYLKDQPAIPLIEGVFEFRYLENRGAAFGMLQDQRLFFLIVTVIILSAILYLIIKLPCEKKYQWLNFTLIVVSAGAVGNMIDRAMLVYVIDFLYFSLIDFPIFNVADIYVTISSIVLGLLYLFYYKEDDFDFLNTKKNKGNSKEV